MIQYINLALNVAIIIYLIIPKWPFYINVGRTTWMKKAYCIYLMKKEYQNEYGSSARYIFYVKLRDYDKLSKWDSECFHNGTFRKKEDEKRKIAKAI